MEHDEMYFVINNNAISIDEMGTPIICDVVDGVVDWDSFDVIDWLDLNPDQYQLYKACVDFLQEYSLSKVYVK